MSNGHVTTHSSLIVIMMMIIVVGLTTTIVIITVMVLSYFDSYCENSSDPKDQSKPAKYCMPS